MKPPQKYLTFLLILAALILALAGCGTEPTETTINDTPPPVPPVESEPPADVPVESEPPADVPVEPATGSAPEETEEPVNIYCTGPDVHPIGESISQTYDVTYEEVMHLFCSGFTFDNILLAFETSQQTDDYSPRELLQMNQTMSWDEIWAEVGIIGND